jgi:alkylation response protein AidB-like acyl-CoA dehydrogenase
VDVGVTAAEVGDEARTWITSNWDADRDLVGWRGLLADSGWAVPSWPRAWFGRDLPAWADDLVATELAAAGAVGTPIGVGRGLAAPTLLAHAADELKGRLLRRILTGEDTWCQLFSEPGAGSDLAGLTTRAELDGEEWIVNGQKVWNTSAHRADYGLLLARTDFDAPKHRGISYFALPMRQAGVEVRPLHQMNGHSSFNEVFLTDARVPVANMIGEPGEGWRGALTTLAHERQFATMRRPAFARHAGRAVTQAAAEADDYFATYAWYPQRAGRADLALSRVAARAADGHDAGAAVARDQAAALVALQRSQQWTAQRAHAARALGRPPGAEGSLGKLGASLVARASARTHSTIAGASAMLTAGDDPDDAVVAEVLVSVPAQSIAGGTDEIQHNILGERILGLPKEPGDDRDQPFSQRSASH